MSEKDAAIFSLYPEYEATIGIEVHIQLQTNTKIFCGCSNNFGDQPNSNICPVCTGQPGSLPVLNKQVINYGIMAGLATNCDITPYIDFSRKHYMYPDLPKNYQITQDDKPICTNGSITIKTEAGTTKKIRIARIHMEEDAGKNIHTGTGKSLVDLNRAGTPLLEVVSHPDMQSSQEARAYLMKLHNLIQYLGISDGNMEEGSFRADANVSVKLKSASELGTRVELKNINSFKFISQAIDYELARHITTIEGGERIKQETRLWDNKKNQSYFMRSKEEAQDYRYFTEPDIPGITITNEWIESIKAQIPELPDAKIARFQDLYQLSEYDATVLAEDQIIARYYEETVKACSTPKLACNWVMREVLGYVKEHKLASCMELKVTPNHLAELMKAIDKGVINSKVAVDVFLECAKTGTAPLAIIEAQGLQQIGSSEELEALVMKVITNNPDNVAKYKAGNDRLFTFFVGQTLKECKGKGNPQIITDLLKKHLA